MSEIRIIKKYPNRRLYDTTISSYVTLEDVRRLVATQVDVKIIDVRTQEDITHSTLLQIIVEQEEKGPALFSVQSLQNMIRTYGHDMHSMMNKMFETGMSYFSNQCKTLDDQANQLHHESDPAKWMTEVAQQNMAYWQKWQQQWMQSVVDSSHGDMKGQRDSHVDEYTQAG